MATIAYAEDTLHAAAPEGDDSDVAVVERFYVESGQPVQQGDAIALLRSARYVYDLPAGAGGIVADFLVTVGGTVEIGAPLIQLLPVPLAPAERADELPPERRAPLSTPLARKIAHAHGYDLATIAGSGRGGQIRAGDVRAAVGEPPPRSRAASAVWQSTFAETPGTVARQERSADGGEQLEVPRASTAFEMHIEAIRALQARDRARHARTRVEPAVVDYIACAALATLVHVRRLNSRWTDQGILIHGAINVGIAGGDTGTTYAVIANAADLSPEGLARARQRAAGGDRQEPTEQATIVVGEIAGGAWWTQGSRRETCGMILGVGAPGCVASVVEDEAGPNVVVRERVVVTADYDARYLSQPEVDAFLCQVKQRVEGL